MHILYTHTHTYIKWQEMGWRQTTYDHKEFCKPNLKSMDLPKEPSKGIT